MDRRLYLIATRGGLVLGLSLIGISVVVGLFSVVQSVGLPRDGQLLSAVGGGLLVLVTGIRLYGRGSG